MQIPDYAVLYMQGLTYLKVSRAAQVRGLVQQRAVLQPDGLRAASLVPDRALDVRVLLRAYPGHHLAQLQVLGRPLAGG